MAKPVDKVPKGVYAELDPPLLLEWLSFASDEGRTKRLLDMHAKFAYMRLSEEARAEIKREFEQWRKQEHPPIDSLPVLEIGAAADFVRRKKPRPAKSA